LAFRLVKAAHVEQLLSIDGSLSPIDPAENGSPW